MVESFKAQAILQAHNNGAQLNSIQIVEMEMIPLQYANNGAVRAIVKAARIIYPLRRYFILTHGRLVFWGGRGRRVRLLNRSTLKLLGQQRIRVLQT